MSNPLSYRSKDALPPPRPPMSRRAKVILTLAILTILGVPGLYVWHQASLLQAHIHEAADMRQIGAAIQNYADAHRGRYPPSLSALFADQKLPSSLAVDPRSGGSAPQNCVDVEGDYIYRGAGLTTGADPDAAILFPRHGVREAYGMNILFGDGHVEFIDGKDVPRALASSDAWRQNWEAGRK